MKEGLRQPGSSGSFGPFYEQPNEGVAGGIKQDKTQQKRISLAELTRQMLRGNLTVSEYLDIERQLTPRFGEVTWKLSEKEPHLEKQGK